MGEFRMPSLGADMDAGTVTEWLVAPGDRVHRGDIVAVVDTDKADVDVEIFEDGVIEQILVAAGEKVPVGTPLALVGTEPAGAATPAPPSVPAPAPTSVPEPEPPSVPEPTHEPPRGAPPAPPAVPTVPTVAAIAPASPAAEAPELHSPVVRRLARHLGVDVATIHGSGPGGTVTRADVEAAARSRLSEAGGREQRPAAAATTATAEPDRAQQRGLAMREAIGRLMTRSKREIPHYYLGTEVDFSRARAWLDQANGERAVTERILPAALLIKAVALAARDAPAMNGFWLDDRFEASGAVHVGVAISLRGGGLVAPAIHDADRKSLDEVMRDLRDLVARTRNGRLRSSEMSEPTITVTNLGDQGVDTVYGVIYPPQVALVGFGKVVERPWAEHGMLGIRPVVSVTLAADHRASDGHAGARFVAQIDRLLQAPEAV